MSEQLEGVSGYQKGVSWDPRPLQNLLAIPLSRPRNATKSYTRQNAKDLRGKGGGKRQPGNTLETIKEVWAREKIKKCT